MALRNTAERWGAVAKLFHWVIALLVLAMIGLGLAAVNWPLTPAKLALFTVHKVTGLTIFVLMIARLGWRLVNPAPILPPTLKGWERGAARATHWMLYGVIFLMPVSGYVVTSAANFPIEVFGVSVPLLVPPSEATQEDAEVVHYLGFLALSALLALHIAAALRHHFLLKDDTLKRMLPGK